MKKIACSLLTLTFLLAGCKTAETILNEAYTRVEPAAAAGILTYYFTNKHVDKELEVALIAAGAGLLYGEYIAQKKAAYKTEEEKLQLDINEINTATKKLKSKNEKMRLHNANLKKEVSKAISLYRGTRDERIQFEKKRDILIRMQKVMKDDIRVTGEMLDYYDRLSKTDIDKYPSKANQIRRGIIQLDSQKKWLETELSNLEYELNRINQTLQG